MSNFPVVSLDGETYHTYTVSYSDIQASSAEELRDRVLYCAKRDYPERAARYRIRSGYSLEPGQVTGKVRVRSVTVEIAVATTQAEVFSE